MKGRKRKIKQEGKINKGDTAEEIREWRQIEVIRRTRQKMFTKEIGQRKRCVSRGDLKTDKGTAA